ncbi:MAG TPA: flavin reductase family protein [Phycisphaerae bacterium]|jgi:flavin reductase (DIM6/NTAB) family NADH-FMN oxidoreductase RutF
MKRFEEYAQLIPAQRERRANHHTLLSCVLPRPIAFVSTLSPEGVANLAPFSFFNAMASNPPTLVFGPATKADTNEKDTVRNLLHLGECVVNVVTYEMRVAMNQASFPYPPDVSEFEKAGFTALPSRLVKPPRVAESPVHMECRLDQIVKIGSGGLAGNICIVEVLCFHIADEICLPDGTADVNKIDLIARLGGDGYSTMRDRFDLPKPTQP